jgi:hypothetical protein
MPRRAKPKETTVAFWWEPDDVRTESASHLSWRPEAQPVVEEMLMAVPRVGQIVTLDLPLPALIRQVPPPISVRGEVTRVSAQKGRAIVHIRRIGRVGLTYMELCAMVNVPVVGYHPHYGAIAGKLVALLPKCQLALIGDVPAAEYLAELADEIEDFRRRAQALLGEAGAAVEVEDDLEDEEEDERPEVVFVD